MLPVALQGHVVGLPGGNGSFSLTWAVCQLTLADGTCSLTQVTSKCSCWVFSPLH